MRAIPSPIRGSGIILARMSSPTTPYRRLLTLGPLVFAPAAAHGQGVRDSAAFVTRLGTDTLAVERFVYSRDTRSGRIEADVLLRVPRTTRTRYTLELSAAGELLRLETVGPRRRETITRTGDSLRVETTDTGAPRVRMVAAEARVLPFIDMVHWPFEPALMRLRASGATQVVQPLLTGARVAGFAMAAVGTDSMTITHPSRGTMRVRVDAAGRLLALDAGATTRKLLVERGRWGDVDVDALASRWTSEDAAGRSLGALSGRRRDTATVAGATIIVDHGTPTKRGRPIWGALVPFGQVWRTGANTATHFTTDRDLVLGAGAETLTVPAGAYTLFSIPDPGGGVLIVSRDTGQAGTAYNPARDLGRVALEWRALAEPVDMFTLAVTPDAGGGEGAGAIRLQWDARELVARFRVAARPE